MAGFDLLGRLFSLAGNRDGQFRALEPGVLGAVAQAPAPHPPTGSARDPLGAIGTKVLEGWLANRQQTLVPHTLNFRALSPEEGHLLLQVMAAAAQADGQVDDSEARQLPQALSRVGAGKAEAEALGRALCEPQPVSALLDQVQEARLATHAYAAALLSINQRGRANRAFLNYLAARLGLSPVVTGSLERRYRA